MNAGELQAGAVKTNVRAHADLVLHDPSEVAGKCRVHGTLALPHVPPAPRLGIGHGGGHGPGLGIGCPLLRRCQGPVPPPRGSG